MRKVLIPTALFFLTFGAFFSTDSLAFTINIDPGAYTGRYNPVGQGSATGSTSIELEAGSNYLVKVDANGGPGNGFRFNVDASGNVSALLPELEGISFQSDGNTIRFNNTTVHIDPVDYTGRYHLPGVSPVAGSGPRSVVVVPGVVQYRVKVDASGGPGNGFKFDVDASGNVSATELEGISVQSDGNTIRFNNTTVHIDPTTYTGLYNLPGISPVLDSGPRSVVVVPGVSQYRLNTNGDPARILFNVGISGEPSPASVAVNTPTGIHTFLFSKVSNQPPVADAGPDQSVDCALSSGADVTLDGSGSSDPDSDPLTYTWTGAFGTTSGVSPTIIFLPGTYTINLTVIDGNGGTASDQVYITVIEDTTPPVIAFSLDATSLWPPNHEMVLVASGVSASDLCDETPVLSIEVISNEEANGKGDGNTESDSDVVDNGDGTYDVYVRAERSGKGDGRVYTIAVTATDASGNSAMVEGTVEVQHDNGKGKGKAKLAAQLAFSLGNFPNPWNPSTTISYALPEAAEVRLAIYSILGQQVRELVHAYQGSGHYQVEWDGRDTFGQHGAAGIYFYRLEAGQQTEVRKMTLAK